MMIRSLYLCVKDMERAIRFYETLLDRGVMERDSVYSVFEVEGFRLGLFAYEKAGEVHTYGSNCLPSMEVEDIIRFERKLEAMGCEIAFPLTEIGGSRVLEFVDSEGNRIEATSKMKSQKEEAVQRLWEDMSSQRWDRLSGYFCGDASVSWPNTNEIFDVNRFVKANKEYPGSWEISLERLESMGGLVISVVNVKLRVGEAAFHAVSFFEFRDGLIEKLTEYWGDDAEAPEWRKNL